MNASAIRRLAPGFSYVFFAIFSLVVLVTVQGCSSSSDPDPTPDQDAGGLFKQGTAELNGGAVMIDDLRAFVHEGRIIAFSISEQILFDGQITGITGDDFTATVTLYETGAATQENISVTGKVTSQSQITGTLEGTDVGAGTFTLTYDNAYETAASFARVDIGGFEGDFLAIESFLTDTSPDGIGISSTGTVLGVVGDVGFSCSLQGDAGSTAIPDSTKSIITLTYDIPEGLSNNDASCTMLPLNPSVKLTGFASQLSETGTDLDLIFAVTNGTYAVFGFATAP